MKIYILTLTLVTSLLISLRAQDYNLFLHGGTEIPEEGLRQGIHLDQMVDGYYYSILQFYDIPTAAVRAQLSDVGIELLVYVPNYAWLARIPAAVNLEDFPLRAIVPLRPQDKIFPSLQTGSFPECLLESGGIKVSAMLYPRVSKNASRASIEQAGFENLLLQGRAVNMTVQADQLEALAGLPFIMAIVPRECDPEKEGIKGRTLVRGNLLNGGTAFTGNGISIGIADDGSVSHEDFRGRITDFTTGDVGTHGDMTVGLAGGCGNIAQRGVGMATAADLFLFDIEGYPHIINAVENFVTYQLEITSTSYGEGCGGYYTYTAQELDQQVFENNNFFHCFSAGNRGFDGCNEIYGGFANDDLTRFGNITGGRKAGKNAIAVGNVYYNDSLRVTSSRGPTNDGRIKPDICAPGQGNLSTGENNTYQEGGGTSAASPVIAGSAALIYQAYGEKYDGISPPSGLIKAMILCSAEDLGRPGPDYEHGWGRIHLGRALEVLEEEQFITDTIEHAFQDYHQITIPDGTGQARIMVYWMDPAGVVLSSKALVNDIDISLQSGAGQLYLPHVLSHYPHYDSLTKPAYRGFDHVNNMEEVILDNPLPGTYTLRVKGHMIPEGPLQYFVVYSFVKDEIEVTYPSAGEGFVPGEKEILRWDAYGDQGTFLLEYSLDGMESWLTIADQVPGHLRYFEWNVPAVVSGNAFIRVSRGDQTAHSEENFTIIGIPSFDFDYVNVNTASISWYPVPGATSYEVYAIGEMFMEQIGSTPGTSFSFPVQLWQSNWYSVRAVINEQAKGIRADAKEYTHQTCNANFGINFQFDLYPGEISWQVTNQSGDVVATGGPYDYLPPNSYLAIEKCLPFGCYTLKIRDAYGDGICCSHGEGYYEFIGQDGQVLTTGGAFGGVKTLYFCLENTMGDLSMNVSSLQNVSCFGGNNGEVTVHAVGGSGNYSYLWSNGATSPHATGLAAGTHSVTVTDGFAQLSTSVTLTQPVPINVNITPVDINCSTITAGSVLTEVSGGLPPYNYFWSTGASTPDIGNLEAGNYKVSVVDANGCLMAAETTVAQNNSLELTTTVVSPGCFGAANGVILATTTGGTGNYSYLWNNGLNTPTVFGIAAGNYQVTVTDSNGCNGVRFVTVNEPEVLNAEGIVTHPGCEGGTTGSIELIVEGGTAPYHYAWDTGQTSYNVYNLSAGNYMVTVFDANGCSDVAAFEVNISSPMVLHFESNSALEGNDGSINLEVDYGMPPYTFAWSNGANSEDLGNIPAGTYAVTVTDDSGCQATGEVNVGGGEYCLLRGSNTNYEWIEKVTWSGQAFVSGKNGGLGLFPGTVFTALTGATHLLEVQPAFSATPFGEYWRIWIDYNGDYDFSDEGEEIFAGGAITGNLSVPVTIPNNAVPGITRMRIAMKYGTLPPLCGTYGYGEVEEYAIQIQPATGLNAATGSYPERALNPEKTARTATVNAFSVYPNPASDYIVIPLETMHPGDLVRCTIYSPDGRKVKTFNIELSDNEPFREISVDNLPEGLYRMELFGNNSVQLAKFVISR